ncbi:MAG TPA: glycosyltransferase family 4 protein [Rhizomicrobium sp.]|jgi:glycosyltransferase involved in cell wall biosynthesis|nr:glycosyltransferase family 4 protein [Rhizomicrobium sp.]
MKIAQIAPLIESVPPTLYGGTERVVSWLTEELVRRGHDVTLFASGDSVTQAQLVPIVPRALRLDSRVRDALPYNIIMLDRVARMADAFDMVHFHIDFFHYPLFRNRANRTLTTLHGRLDLPDLVPVYREFPQMPVVSISNNQRLPMPPVRWMDTVYHGLPHDMYRLREQPGQYLAFLGRITPEKGPEEAIAIAKRVGIPLKMAAKVDAVDREYFETRIKPLLDHPLIEFIGEINDSQKQEFLGDALALLFPIDWPEPFGLVMIEAAAVGTPVVAFRRGSVPEVIVPGVSGYIVDNVDEAVAAVPKAAKLNRAGVRRVFDKRFTVKVMAEHYLSIYDRLVNCDGAFAQAAE